MAETNTGYPFIYLDGNPDVVIDSTGGCISIPIVAQNCTFSSCTVSNNNNTALTVTVANQVITFCMQATDNTAFTLADTLSLTFYDTDGKHFQQGCRVYQKGTQDSGNLGTVTINGQSAFTFDYYTGGTAYLYVSSTVDLTNAVVDGTQTFVNANASPFYRVEHANGGYKIKLQSQPIGYEYSEGSEPPISDLVGALQIRIHAEDGNTYYLNNVLISQPYYTPKPIETQKDARFLESTTSVTSAVQYTSATAKVGSNSDTTQYDGTVYFISAATYPSGSFPADFPMGDVHTPSYVGDVPIYLNGDGEIRSCSVRVPENNSGQDRQAVLYFSAVTIYKDKETWEDIQNINEIITFTINQSRGTGSTSGDTSGSTSGDTSGSTSGDTSGSTSGDTSGSTSGDTSGSTPNIYLSGGTNMSLDATGSCRTLPIVAVNCDYDTFNAIIEYNPNLAAHSTATVTESNRNLVFCLTENPTANTGYTEVAIVTVTLFDTSGNSYINYCGLNQYPNSGSTPTPPDPTIPTGSTVDSGSTSHTITYSGCPLVFDHSASTGTWNTLPTVTTAGTTDNWSLTYDVPANDTDSARTITYYYLRYSGETCEDLVDTVSYTISQNAGSGSTPTPGITPDPWSNTGDTAYTWYKDDSLLRVLPSSRVLSYDEETAYWPVTAHTFNNVGVRASGDVVFNYELIADGSAEYNSHSLYAHTQNNTGTTQQVSTIKLVAFSGSSAYSASTMLMKDPDSHGWITASPNPVNGASSQNSVNVYLTLTNCERNISKETTDNAVFDAATWVTVSRVNNTTLTFNFQANNSNQARSTYYYAYGLDNSGNNVYCRIDITQAANSMGITITPDRTSLGKPAGSFTARVESTESGNFSFSAASWMVVRSYVPESQKAGTLYVDYYENTGKYTRVGDITVSQQISTAPYILTARTQISQTNTAYTAYIRVTPSSISVDRTAGVVEAQVSYAGLATVPALVQNEGNMSIVSYNLDSGLITVAYGANDTSMDKHKNFTVTAMSSNGNVIEANFTITQGGTGLPVAPIWRDYVITVPTPGQGYINYNINYDGTVVYTGRAYGMGQDNIEIYYNHLCKPFLSNHIDFTEGYQSIRDWLGNFIITSPELGDITSVSFYEDYSYVNRDITNVMSLNNPIINEVVEGSYVPFSFFITGTSGNVSIMQNGQQITGLTVNDNEQHRYFVEAEKGKAYSSLGAVYKTIPVCSARYSLYYINSYGGVDVLPFKGKSFKKTDNITRLNYSRSFRNNTLEFENVNYMNEMKPAWELNTSYMVDSQSRKMHELVESTCVYLYDAEEQTYTPVVMTDKKLEYKTFYNQGRRFYIYTINVEESQSRERR